MAKDGCLLDCKAMSSFRELGYSLAQGRLAANRKTQEVADTKAQ
jgi:hypothetical protein